MSFKHYRHCSAANSRHSTSVRLPTQCCGICPNSDTRAVTVRSNSDVGDTANCPWVHPKGIWMCWGLDTRETISPCTSLRTVKRGCLQERQSENMHPATICKIVNGNIGWRSGNSLNVLQVYQKWKQNVLFTSKWSPNPSLKIFIQKWCNQEDSLHLVNFAMSHKLSYKVLHRQLYSEHGF